MNIDDLQEISALDTDNMFDMVFSWPELIEGVLLQSIEIPYSTHFSQIVICGMGGSAISGDYIQTYFENSLSIPIIVKRNYRLPVSINSDTLVIAISYSGNTEETISCLIDAIQNNCSIISIGSGGKLEDYCSSARIPFFKIPAGYQPRASFPLLFFPILKIFDLLEIANMNQTEIQETIHHLKKTRERLKPQIPTESNQAKELRRKAKNYLDSYTKASYDPESGMEKVNSDFFDPDTG